LPNRRIAALKLIKEGTACVRLQRCWRKKLDREQGPPIVLRKLMRGGYIRGEGMVRDRRVYRPVWWTLGMVNEVFGTYLHVMSHSGKICQSPPSLSSVVYRFFVNRWGCVSLAERDLHDFYVNVRALAAGSARCRMFVAFTRCFLKLSSVEDKRMCVEFGMEDESLHFYLRSALLVHEIHEKHAQAQAKKINNSYSPSKFFLLFPTTSTDARGKQKWCVPSAVLTSATKGLFGAIYDKGGGGEGKKGYLQLLHKVEDLASGSDKLADVDEWLWCVMAHWFSVKERRKELSMHMTHGDNKKDGRTAFTAMGRYRAATLQSETSANLDLGLDGDESAGGGGEEKKEEGGKPPKDKKRSYQEGAGRTSRHSFLTSTDESDVIEEHHKHKQEMFSHSAMYQEVLQIANKHGNPGVAVSSSLHKHMMSDINLPLPLSRLPATDGATMAKQLLVAWSGFDRPMKFLVDELVEGSGEEGGEVKQEVADVQLELDYFKELVKKLQDVLGVEGEGTKEGGEVRAEAGSGSRPSTSTGDNKRGSVLELAVQSFSLLRHLCDKVKTAHAHEAVHEDEGLHDTKRDPLLLLHHPLKDQWAVGKPPEIV